ncbi:ATPase AAA [Sorangium cellulosum]|uniref:ATPase AAA n=1 Tax=Sorangium cellulosum TaxID=56 RepID=A0A2L0EHQ1_SORCE|nr:ATP-binding protein [Sorangium cellulosum]AUX38811.1 ATPase AAA [Sorangium cellulosum]AUX46087.1 ATPase AAA [Sorangium cellulosum]AUX48074.1 ATPase AAA [Sorangium cellulosum]
MTTRPELEAMLKKLHLFGCLARLDELENEPWLTRLVTLESEERTRRSLENRTRIAGLGSYKALCDFDWTWPKKIDRSLVEELFLLRFVAEGANVVLLGPNGVGKTMLLKNLACRALHAGHPVLVRSASDLLADLAGQESSVARARRLRAYVQPAILCIDEVGYLSYDTRHADLLFEVVTRRYEKNKSIVLTTNKPFAEWPTVFPNAACVVTLVDRLLHRAELVVIEGDSYRLRDAQERQLRRSASRRRSKEPPAVA